MNSILSIIGGLFALVTAILYGLFKSEKNKRIKAEDIISKQKKEIATKEVEADTATAARREEKATADKLDKITIEVKESIKETEATAPADQTQLYNEKVKGWRKVTR